MRIGGVCYLKIDGKMFTAGEGEWSFNVGGLKREAKLSSSGVAGFTAKPQVPYCEGDLLHVQDLDFSKLINLEGGTVTLELYNNQTFVLQEAYWAADGEGSSDGTIKARFEGLRGELING